MPHKLNSDVRLQGKRILVVEDEIFLAFWIEDVLVEAGAQVVGPAGTVSAALELVETALLVGELDGAVLDYNLGGQMSLPVAAALAKRGIPFLFQTAYHDVPTMEGVVLISKPYSASTLVAALDEIVM